MQPEVEYFTFLHAPTAAFLLDFNFASGFRLRMSLLQKERKERKIRVRNFSSSRCVVFLPNYNHAIL
jgi:hypothetical protein